MFTGRLIDELMATVERAERHADPQMDSAEMHSWCSVAPYELKQIRRVTQRNCKLGAPSRLINLQQWTPI